MLRQPVAPEDITFDGSYHHRIGQLLSPATKAFDQKSQFTAAAITLLHLIQPIEQRLPILAPGWWRYAAVNPQPVRKFMLVVKIPCQRSQYRHQQQPRQIIDNHPSSNAGR